MHYFGQDSKYRGRFALLAAAAAAFWAPTVGAASWGLTAAVSGSDFFEAFSFSTGVGAVESFASYRGQDAARAAGLATIDEAGAFVMRVDSTSVLKVGESRHSVRIESKASYGDGLYVLDVAHAPTGCATWPAFWTRPRSSSYNEIDIAENVNSMYPQALSVLHTRTQCSIQRPSSSNQTGTTDTTNCSVLNPAHTGCLTRLSGTSTTSGNKLVNWGDAFNAAGGGTFAMERLLAGPNAAGVRVWTWQRGQEPSNLAQQSINGKLAAPSAVDTSSWGVPAAYFPVQECADEDWSEHMIVLNIALCGEWATGTYGSSGCGARYASCATQVALSPESFANAYWSLRSMQVYTSGISLADSPVPANPSASSSTGTSAAAPADTVAGTSAGSSARTSTSPSTRTSANPSTNASASVSSVATTGRPDSALGLTSNAYVALAFLSCLFSIAVSSL